MEGRLSNGYEMETLLKNTKFFVAGFSPRRLGPTFCPRIKFGIFYLTQKVGKKVKWHIPNLIRGRSFLDGPYPHSLNAQTVERHLCTWQRPSFYRINVI
ncbi:hypothetical protein ABID22_000632 [Pontibacter aydingkolensis]